MSQESSTAPDFESFQALIPEDTDSLLTTYLFRGWFLTTMVEDGPPRVGECPCCGKPFDEKKCEA